MANALALVADEIGQATTLIWSGIGIAVKLNYEVMSHIVTTTARIVQLLLLLTHKASDVLTIITNDSLLFLGDIGNGLFAISKTLHALASGISSAVQAMVSSGYAATLHIYSLFGLLYYGIINFVVYLIAQLGNLMLFIRSAFILLGSSTLFAITFIPNLLHLFGNSVIASLLMAKITFDDALNSLKNSLSSGATNFVAVMVKYFKSIPLNSVLGVGFAIIIGFCLKFLFCYLIEHQFFLPNNFSIFSICGSICKKICNFFVHLWQAVRKLMPNLTVVGNQIEEDNSNIDYENGIDDNANEPNLHQVSGTSSIPSQNIQLPTVSAELNQSVNYSDSLLYNRTNLTRRPLSRRQQILGLADPVTEDEVLQSNNPGSNKKVSKDNTNHCPIPDSQWAKQLYRELEAERENQLCVICQDKPKRVILLPCRHLCLCDSCRSAVIIRNSICPMCRRPITDTLRVYV